MTGPDLVERVRDRLAAGGGRLESVLRHESGEIADDRAFADLRREVAAELIGAGPLEPLLALDGVTDVLVNAPDSVWIDRGRGMERVAVSFADEAAVRRLAQRLAASAGRRIDDASPYVDATLADGTRLHAVLPPVTKATTLSLRVLARRRLTLDELTARGTVPEAIAELLRCILSARLAFVLTGGTGSGKTTLLAALLGLVPQHERVIVIEDAPELLVDHPHFVRLVARPPNVEGAGAIGLRELVRQSLRMRPDRLVVGEFRGAEVIELLVALNTGHEGGAATLHANSAADVPARFAALGALAGLGEPAVASLVASAIDLVIHLQRRDARRDVVEVALLSWTSGGLQAVPVWSAAGGAGAGLDTLAARLLARGVELPSGALW